MSGDDRSPGVDPVAADGPGSELVGGAGPLLPGAGLNSMMAHLVGSAPGQFTVDFDRAPQAIADLEHAAEFLEARVDRAMRLGTIPEPGVDEVSVQVVREIGKWATEGPNSLVAALESGAAELNAMAAVLRADLATHMQTETLNVPLASEGLEL